MFTFFKKAYSFRDNAHQYLQLLLLPFLLCVVLFVAVHFVTSKQIKAHAEQTATQFYVQSSSMLRELHLFGEALTSNTTFMEMISANDPKDVDPQRFCAFIRDSMNKSSYIHHVYVVNDRLNGIYSDEGYFSKGSLPSLLSKLGMGIDEFISVSDSSDAGRQLINSSSFAPYCFVPLVNSAGENAGTALVALNMTEFLKNFYLLDASFCCIFDDQLYISSLPTLTVPEKFDWRNENNISSLVGEPVTCVYRETSDYTYLVAIANSEYNQPLLIIIGCFSLYAAAVFLFQFFSLRKISVKRKTEINSLIDALPEYQGEASYAAVIPEVKKSLSEYQKNKNEVPQTQERNLRYILYGHNQYTISEEFIISAGIPSPFERWYYVANFFLRDISSSSVFDIGKPSTGTELASLILRSVLEGQLGADLGSAFCSDTNSLVAVFWADNPQGFKERISEISLSAADLLFKNYNVSVQIMLSSPFQDIQKLSNAFNTTRELNEFSHSIDSNRQMILHEDLLIRGNSMIAPDFIRQEQILINTLIAQKFHQIPDMVQSILEKSAPSSQLDYDLARCRLRSIANILTEAVLSTNPENIPAEDIVHEFRHAKTAAELNAITEKHFTYLSQQIEESADENEIVRKACEYISDNICDHNLNVSAICESVEVSAQRLTRMFRLHFDMTIAEYISTRRIEHSKELLRNHPELNVAQIAEIVGYNNTHSLARNFRKLEGLTPSEYRELRL